MLTRDVDQAGDDWVCPAIIPIPSRDCKPDRRRWPYERLTVTVTGDRDAGGAEGSTQGDVQISADDETTAQEYGRFQVCVEQDNRAAD
jgi:hypothetical protein